MSNKPSGNSKGTSGFTNGRTSSSSGNTTVPSWLTKIVGEGNQQFNFNKGVPPRPFSEKPSDDERQKASPERQKKPYNPSRRPAANGGSHPIVSILVFSGVLLLIVVGILKFLSILIGSL